MNLPSLSVVRVYVTPFTVIVTFALAIILASLSVNLPLIVTLSPAITLLILSIAIVVSNLLTITSVLLVNLRYILSSLIETSMLFLPGNNEINPSFTVVFVAEDEGIANDGIVIFKINGVTLRNSDGGAVNSTVVNGIASISYTIPSSFSAKNYTITAVYSNNNYNRVESTVNLTIIKSNAKTQLSPISTVHGENTTLNITLYDQKGRQIIRDNKLAVKINGKTYVHSVYTNGSANIVIPTESLKTGHYNLTIVFGANNAYNSLRLDTILFITMPVIDDSQNSTMKNETEIKAL